MSDLATELTTLHSCLGIEDALKVKVLARAVAAFDAAADKQAVTARLAAELARHGITGITVPSMYRKCQAWRRGGILALVDGRLLRKHKSGGLADNKEFVEFWQAILLSNKRKSAPAYRELINRLRTDEYIPGFGTWRDIWTAEHNGVHPDLIARCPYRHGGLVPQGWTMRNLNRLAPGQFAITASRQGMMAAQMQSLPDIIRTRVGLAPCQVVQLDDMWYEHKVSFASNKHAQRVVEFALQDVLTGHVIVRLTKPVREREDGTRETLKGVWTRYILAHLLCSVGIPKGGCMIVGEHGTASADTTLKEILGEVSGGAVRFVAGGILSEPLAKGLYSGRPHGNPRIKGMLEGLHALVKNELGSVRGHMGGGRGAEPETVYGMDQADERLRAIARGLERSRPGILDRLRLPYIPYYDFLELVHQAYERIDTRTVHDLEGWEQCGFVTGEYQIEPRGPWIDIASLDAMSVPKANAFRALIQTGEIAYRTRNMSPREAWESRKSELTKLDGVAAVLVMGTELSQLCDCNDKLQLKYRDDTTLTKCTVSGILHGGRILERGQCYRVWINPCTPLTAYVADAQGRYIGTADVQQAARYDDIDAVQKQLGLRQQALAAARKTLTPIIRKQLREEAAAAAHNAREILGEDPAELAAIADAARLELAGVKADISDDDLMPDHNEPDAIGISDDDIL